MPIRGHGSHHRQRGQDCRSQGCTRAVRVAYRQQTELRETEEGLVLKPVENEPLWRRENGRLVFYGRPIGKVDWDRIVDDMREGRIREIVAR